MLNILHFKDSLYAEVSKESVQEGAYTYCLLVDDKYFVEIDEVVNLTLNKFANRFWIENNKINICYDSINAEDMIKLLSLSKDITVSSIDLGCDTNILVQITF